jgi:ribose 5-phosphate isomerase B
MSLRIAIASDHAGFDLKAKIVSTLTNGDEYTIIDLGPAEAIRCDYPDYAAAVSKAVQSGEADRGILVCGSGIGVSMVANKHNGIRAALAHNAVTARLSREHNDANVLCLGSRIIGDVLAQEAVDLFLSTDFQGGRHADRLQKMAAVEGD